MSEHADANTLDLERVVASAVAAASRNASGLMSQEDMIQEAWVWLLSHPKDVQRDPGQPALVAWRLIRSISHLLREMDRREKAAYHGYNPDDEFHYSASKVAEYLPHVLDGTYEKPARPGLEGKVTVRHDPAESADWQAYRADVAMAWERAPLTRQERQMVVSRYVWAETWPQIAAEWDLSLTWARRKTQAAMRKLIAVIGDEKPEVEWTYLDSRLRERPAKRRW